MPENLEEFGTKESGYNYEYEAQQFLAEIACLPTSLRPRRQLYHVERTIAEASGGLMSGNPVDFTYEDGEWKGYKQIGIITADEHVIFSLKCCERVVAEEME
jgi:hypothetical protein